MADLSLTPGSVVSADGSAYLQTFTAGAAITAGQLVYVDAADGTVKLAYATSTAAIAAIKGIAVDDAASGQPCIVKNAGDIDLGVTLTVGVIYILSANAGAIAPSTDLASSSYLSILGVATAADNLKLNIFNSGAEKP